MASGIGFRHLRGLVAEGLFIFGWFKAKILGSVAGHKKIQNARSAEQQHRQTKNPPPVKLHDLENHKRGDKGQDGRAPGCKHIKPKHFAPFTVTPPVGEDPPARGPAHRLGEAVESPANDQTGEGTADTHQPVQAAGEYGTEAHHPSATELVPQISIDRLPSRVGPEQGGTAPAERLLIES